MSWQQMDDAGIAALLHSAQTVAVVGVSARTDRPSHYVSDYLIQTGQYEVQFVNPALDEVLGQKAFPTLRSLPVAPDLVVVFRRAEDLAPVLDDALAAGARALWIQLGIVNHEIADQAVAAGMSVVMDRCIMVEHRRLIGGAETTPA